MLYQIYYNITDSCIKEVQDTDSSKKKDHVRNIKTMTFKDFQ